MRSNLQPARQETFLQAAELLRQGKLVAIPTETVYGLGADAKNPSAVNKIFAAKGRPADHPLIVHLADVNQLGEWAVNIPDAAYQLAETFWPGPLTLVLNKHPSVPYEVTGGQDTVAVRVPNHPAALAVLRAFGGGIAAPSANRYCRISPTQAIHVAEELDDKVDLILDSGACEVGLESTIIDLTRDVPRLLRPGQIGKTDIEKILHQAVDLPDVDEEIHAPGNLEIHYAPLTRALLCSASQMQYVVRGDAFQHRQKLGLLTYRKIEVGSEFEKVVCLSDNSSHFGQALYAALRDLDDAGLDLIIVDQPPQTDAWLAVNDRLTKATQPMLPKPKEEFLNALSIF